ncbi:MAG: hypothetical protein QMC09_10340, partial [Thauera sp.]
MTHKLTAFLAFVFVIAMLGLTPAPGHAAEPASGSTSEQAGHQRLADLLEDEAARTALVEQLRTLEREDFEDREDE